MKQAKTPFTLMLIVLLVLLIAIYCLPIPLHNSVLITISTLTTMLLKYIIQMLLKALDRFWVETVKDWFRKLWLPPKLTQKTESECADMHENKDVTRAVPHLSDANEGSEIRTECCDGDEMYQITFVVILINTKSADSQTP